MNCKKQEENLTVYSKAHPTFVVKNASISYQSRMETTPVVFNNKVYDVISNRENLADPDFEIYEAESRKLISRVRKYIYFGGALVYQNELYVYGTTNSQVSSPLKIYKSSDLINFTEVGALTPAADRRIFNSSLIQDGSKFVMVVEEDENASTYFFPNFYESTDLVNWKKVSELRFTDYIACPTLRYVNGQYYVFYLLNDRASHLYYTSISKSSDLINWTQSHRVVLTPTDESEGQNNSDLDLYEFNGQVVINYAIGNQDHNRTPWADVKKATYQGTMADFVDEFFKPE